MSKEYLTNFIYLLTTIQYTLDESYNNLPYEDDSFISKDLSDLRSVILLFTRKVINYRDESL